MRKGDFVEAQDRKFAGQLRIFANNLVPLADSLGISAEDLATIQADAYAMEFAVSTQQSMESLRKSWTLFKDNLRGGKQGKTNMIPGFGDPLAPPPLVLDGVEARFRKWAQRIKAHKNYSVSIGSQLGIVSGPVAGISSSSGKPTIFELGISGSRVFLKWRKGRYDGINIYRKRKDQAFQLAGTDLKPNWMDPAPLPTEPEVWIYKIIYIKDDQEVGEFSDESQVLVVGL